MTSQSVCLDSFCAATVVDCVRLTPSLCVLSSLSIDAVCFSNCLSVCIIHVCPLQLDVPVLPHSDQPVHRLSIDALCFSACLYALYHFVHFSYVCQYCHAVTSLSTGVSVCVCPRRCWRTWWCVQPRNRTPAACACCTCPRYPTRCTWWTSSTAPLPPMPSHLFPPLTS